jgi:hypothetical protein
MSTSAPKDRIPPGLLVGLIGLGVGSAAIWLGWGESLSRDDAGDLRAQLMIGGPALLIAALVVALAGADDLRLRVPEARRGNAWLIRVGLWILIGYEVAELLRQHWFDAGSTFSGQGTYLWLRRLSTLGAVTVAGGVLATGWDREPVRALSAPVLVFAVLSQPPDAVLQWSFTFLQANRWLFFGFQALVELGFVALLLVVIRETMRGSGEPTARPWHQAAAGYFQAGSALTARVAIAVAGVMFALFAVVTRSPGVAKVWLYGVPVAVLVVTLGFVTAILRAGSDDDHDAPVIRLHLAAGLATFGGVVPAIQAMILYQGGDAEAVQRVLEVAAPAAALGGFLCLISAIGTVAERTRLTVTRESTVRTGLLVTGVSAAAVAVEQWFAHEVAGGTAKDAGVFALTAIATAIASVVALLQVARLCQRISADMHTAREGAALPRAEARIAELDPEHEL